MTTTPRVTLHDAWTDLLLGSRCAVCARPGRALCPRCARALPTTARVCWPDPTPVGLCRPSAVGDYAPPLQPLVVAHKEHGRLALAGPLGRLLAVSVQDTLRAHRRTGAAPVDPRGGVRLVPVPSHPAVVRGRGHDPLLRLTREAARVLRRQGVAAAVLPLLRVLTRPEDQAGLGAGGRAENVAGRFAVRARARPEDLDGVLVLVDDVVTTGSTLREAQRALEQRGASPVGAAVVAATRRRGSLGIL